jgi:DNA-binding MarR family transcriptional regulator
LEHVPAEVRQSGNAEISLNKLKSTIDYLIDAKLTAAEYRLYLYLTELDPLNGNFQKLTEPREIIERLGINRDTFFVGIAKLKELGLYDLKETSGLSKKIAGKIN